MGILILAPIPPLRSAEIGDILSHCVLSQLNSSDQFSQKNIEDNILYLDFWASWCPPCAKSFPFLNKLHKQHSSEGLKIIGINLDEKTKDAENFLDKYPADFNISLNFSKQCAKELGVSAMPSSYLIDRQGIIRHIHLGFRSSDTSELRELVKQLLSDSGTLSLRITN